MVDPLTCRGVSANRNNHNASLRPLWAMSFVHPVSHCHPRQNKLLDTSFQLLHNLTVCWQAAAPTKQMAWMKKDYRSVQDSQCSIFFKVNFNYAPTWIKVKRCFAMICLRGSHRTATPALSDGNLWETSLRQSHMDGWLHHLRFICLHTNGRKQLFLLLAYSAAN